MEISSSGTSWKLFHSHWRSWCLLWRLPQSFITRLGFHDCKTAVSRVDGNHRNGAKKVVDFKSAARIHIPIEMKFLSSFTTLNICDTSKFVLLLFFCCFSYTHFPVEPSRRFLHLAMPPCSSCASFAAPGSFLRQDCETHPDGCGMFPVGGKAK